MQPCRAPRGKREPPCGSRTPTGMQRRGTGSHHRPPEDHRLPAGAGEEGTSRPLHNGKRMVQGPASPQQDSKELLPGSVGLVGHRRDPQAHLRASHLTTACLGVGGKGPSAMPLTQGGHPPRLLGRPWWAARCCREPGIPTTPAHEHGDLPTTRCGCPATSTGVLCSWPPGAGQGKATPFAPLPHGPRHPRGLRANAQTPSYPGDPPSLLLELGWGGQGQRSLPGSSRPSGLGRSRWKPHLGASAAHLKPGKGFASVGGEEPQRRLRLPQNRHGSWGCHPVLPLPLPKIHLYQTEAIKSTNARKPGVRERWGGGV